MTACKILKICWRKKENMYCNTYMKVTHSFNFDGLLVDIDNKVKFTFNIYIKNIMVKGKRQLYGTTNAIPNAIEIEDDIDNFYYELEFELISSKIFGPDTLWNGFYITDTITKHKDAFKFTYKKNVQLSCMDYKLAINDFQFQKVDPLTNISILMKTESLVSIGVIKFSEFVNNYNHDKILKAKKNGKTFVDTIKTLSTDYCHRHNIYYHVRRQYFE